MDPMDLGEVFLPMDPMDLGEVFLPMDPMDLGKVFLPMDPMDLGEVLFSYVHSSFLIYRFYFEKNKQNFLVNYANDIAYD